MVVAGWVGARVWMNLTIAQSKGAAIVFILIDDGSLETPHTLSDGEIEDDIGAPPGEIGWNVERSGLRNNRSTQRNTFQSIFFDIQSFYTFICS